MNILIVGAGNVGRHLARMLVDADHTVTLIERDQAVVERARQESGARVVRGDASEPSVLEKAGIRGMDVVVATTGGDEDNIVISNLAKFEFGVPRVVARVKNALNTWLYEPDIGVDLVVSAPDTIAQLIEEEVAVGDVVQLLTLPEGREAIVEITIPASSPVAGESIGAVVWPPGCVPLALVRASHVLAISPESLMQTDDRLLCAVDMTHKGALHSLIRGEPEGADGRAI
jgi:trk system potassium uptake protein TrkA